MSKDIRDYRLMILLPSGESKETEEEEILNPKILERKMNKAA